MATTEVLIVGAGPSGLVLAIELARRGVEFRIIDQTAEPGTTSRALAVHARTLEFYQALGFAEEVVAEGYEMKQVNLFLNGRDVGSIRLGDAGQDLSPFPFILVYPQDRHERFLIGKLEALGHQVERERTLVGLVPAGDHVEATVSHADGSTETINASYVCGADGAHSAVRKLSGISFPGRTHDQQFFVADVIASGPTADGGLHACPGKNDLCLVFPMLGTGHVRLIGLIPRVIKTDPADPSITFEDVRSFVAERAGLTVSEVHWFSRYKAHHRVAETFQKDRCFLLGDAGHIHSPVGGQGMNTGIGDAVNLAWKLAEVLKRGAPVELLATYSPERLAFAKKLVSTTDRIFTRLIDPSFLGSMIRTVLMGYVLPPLTRLSKLRRAMFYRVSQLAIEYRASRLSQGRSGALFAGDRLPWIRTGATSSNFDTLKNLCWQVHLYGHASQRLKRYCQERDLPIEVFSFNDAAAHAGVVADTLYLVRPDGYLGLVDPTQDPAVLEGYVRKFVSRSSLEIQG